MREFLENAEAERGDGYRRAKLLNREALPKRFYEAAATEAAEGGFCPTLDGHRVKTPGGQPVVVPTQGLATTLAGEWAAQGEHIDPRSMPLTRLINSAIESGEGKLDAFRDEVVKYAAGDMLLYRADYPDSLVARQEALWDPPLLKLARHFGVAFQPTIGIVHQPQPEATLARLRDALAGETLLPLTALVSITSITGSGLLAIALRAGLMSAEEVWTAAHVDEDFNTDRWGVVEEHTARRAFRRTEYDAAVLVLGELPAA